LKTALYSVAALVIFVLLSLAVLSMFSRQQPLLGLRSGKLLPCPETPNCVCSEAAGLASSIAPIAVNAEPQAALEHLKSVLKQQGGEIITESENYLRLSFSTRIFRFVDDLELRLDFPNKLIHVRSASRVGHSDLDANRLRVEAIRAAFESNS